MMAAYEGARNIDRRLRGGCHVSSGGVCNYVANQDLVHAIGLEEPGGSPVHIIEAGMAAQAYARLNRFADAITYIDALTPVLQQLQPRDWGFNGAVGRASHAIWDMARAEHAAEYKDFAMNLLNADVGDWTNTSLELTVARMSALLGRDDEAKDYFARARAKLGAKQHDPRRAIVDHDQAIALRLGSNGSAEERHALLDQALETFTKRKMRGWADRVTAEKRNG